MTLSEYEKAQFESLTAGFEVEDVKVLKKLEKLDKARSLSFASLPGLSLVPLVLAFAALLFVIGERIAGNTSQMFIAGGIGVLCIWVSMLVSPRTPVEETGDAESEQL